MTHRSATIWLSPRIGTLAGLIDTESTDEAQAQVDAAVEELAQTGIKAHGIVRSTIYGYAAREIVEDARNLGVGVIHLADRPVLVVR
jgi:hypothetical protein